MGLTDIPRSERDWCDCEDPLMNQCIHDDCPWKRMERLRELGLTRDAALD
jgi:hypothetical protein